MTDPAATGQRPKGRAAPPEVDRQAGAAAAIAARRARAALKQALAAGEREPVAVLAESRAPGSAAASLRVPEFLASIPGIGVVKREALLERLGIAPAKRLGGLGARQRERLEDWLRARAGLGPRPEPRLVVLAGPTAVGKGAVSTHIRDHHPEVLLSVSATTRPPRPGEVDGVNYSFIDDARFDQLVERGEMLEWAVVHNRHRYGTPREPVQRALDGGRSVLLEIDIQGARQVRRAMPEAVLVFLLPPSWEELVRRLTGRGTESAEEQTRRLATARVELAAQDEFDVRIVNEVVADAAAEVVELLGSSAVRTQRRKE